MNQLPHPPMQASAPPTPSVEVLHHRPIRWLRPAGLAAAGVAALIIAVGLIGRGMASQSLQRWTDAEAIPTVSVIRPDASASGGTLVLPGQVQAFYSATIRSRVDGYLKRSIAR